MVGLRGHKLQVLWSIVVPYLIPMMDYLTRQKQASELLLHRQPVFENIAVAVCRRMTLRKNIHIAFVTISSAFEVIGRVALHALGTARARAVLSGLSSKGLDWKRDVANGAIDSHTSRIVSCRSSIAIPAIHTNPNAYAAAVGKRLGVDYKSYPIKNLIS